MGAGKGSLTKAEKSLGPGAANVWIIHKPAAEFQDSNVPGEVASQRREIATYYRPSSPLNSAPSGRYNSSMSHTTAAQRRHLESASRADLERYQLGRLNALLDQILPANQFYAQKLARVKRPVESLAELSDWPCTFKEELLGH